GSMWLIFFFFQAEDGIRYWSVTGVQTCALPIFLVAQLGHPIFWLDMMGTPLVVVSGADLVAELCDEKRFDKAVRGSLRRVRMLEIGRASCRERGWMWGVGVWVKRKKRGGRVWTG